MMMGLLAHAEIYIIDSQLFMNDSKVSKSWFFAAQKSPRRTMAAAEMMCNLVLTLSVGWLPAMDALAATCVNTDWNA
jgi:hypothetical protein